MFFWELGNLHDYYLLQYQNYIFYKELWFLYPTLPRINKILCPNSECTTNTKNTEREIIYLRYDDVNIKYIYVCSTCDSVWKTDEPV